MNSNDIILPQPERSESGNLPLIVNLFLIGMLGSSGFLFAPLWVGGFIGSAQWSAANAGFLLSSELLGAAVGSLVLLFGRTASLGAAGLIILSSANAVTAFLLGVDAGSVELLVGTRGLAGLGGGACLAATYVGLGNAPNPDRLFALFLGATLLVSGIGFYAFPPAMDAIGLLGLYVFWAAAGFVGLGFFGVIKRQFSAVQKTSDQGSLPGASAVLLALFLLFSAQGAIWTFLEPLAAQTQITSEKLGLILAMSSGAGFLGGLANAAQGNRLGRRWPTLIGLSTSTILIGLLSPPISEFFLTLSICGLQFLWCYSIPFLMGGLSESLSDRRGMAAGVFVQLTGLGVGPFIVSSALLFGGELSVIVYVAIGFTVLTLFSTFSALRTNRSLE